MNNYTNDFKKCQVATQILHEFFQNLVDTEFKKYTNALQEQHTNSEGIIDKNYHKNGSTPYQYVTKYGNITLSIPRLRNPNVKFTPSIIHSDYKSHFDVEKPICLLYGLGLSCTSISTFFMEAFDLKLSSSKVSNITKMLDKDYDDFNNRDLYTIQPQVLYIDTTYFKIRDNGRYRKVAYHVIIALDSKGKKQIIYADALDSESCNSWMKVFKILKKRGLGYPKLIVVDGCTASHKAIKIAYPNATIQVCLFHLIANIRRLLNGNDEKIALKLLSSEFFSGALDFNSFKVKLYASFPNYHINLDSLFKSRYLNQYQLYHDSCWKSIQTNNSLESVNQELKLITSSHKTFGSISGLNRALITVINRINHGYTENDISVDFVSESSLLKETFIKKEYKYSVIIQTGAKSKLTYYCDYDKMEVLIKMLI
jgi:transposase-like protein